MKKFILHSTLFTFGLWLLITLFTTKSIRFTDNKTETILGAIIAVCVALLFLWLTYQKNKMKNEKDSYKKM